MHEDLANTRVPKLSTNSWEEAIRTLIACAEAGETNGAFEAGQRALTIGKQVFQPHDRHLIDTYIVVAGAAESTRRQELALDYYETAIGLTKGIPDLAARILLLAAQTCIGLKDYERGTAFCNRLIELCDWSSSQNPLPAAQAHFIRACFRTDNLTGSLTDAQADFGRGCRHLEQGLQLNKEQAMGVALQVALLFREAHRPQEALSILSIAISGTTLSEHSTVDIPVHLQDAHVTLLLECGRAHEAHRLGMQYLKVWRSDTRVPSLQCYGLRQRIADALVDLGEVDTAIPALCVSADRAAQEEGAAAQYISVMLRLQAAKICLQEGRPHLARTYLDVAWAQIERGLAEQPALREALQNENDQEDLAAKLRAYIDALPLQQRGPARTFLQALSSYYELRSNERDLAQDTDTAQRYRALANQTGRYMRLTEEQRLHAELLSAGSPYIGQSADDFDDTLEALEALGDQLPHSIPPDVAQLFCYRKAQSAFSKNELFDAREHAEEALRRGEALPGATKVLRMALTRILFARIEYNLGETAAATEHLVQTQQSLRENMRADHPLMLDVLQTLARCAEASGNSAEAADYDRGAQALRTRLQERNGMEYFNQ